MSVRKIQIKSEAEIRLMRTAGRIAKEALRLGGDAVSPGVTTQEIDEIIALHIKKCGAKASFKGYNGFPGSACVSINEEVIHGIPGKRVIREGDLVKVDVGAFCDGYHGDCAATYPAGRVDEKVLQLATVTRESFYEGLKFAREGFRISDISCAIQTYIEKYGYSVVRSFVGHGIGSELHEAPEVPNFGSPGHGARLVRGMTLAIEPMTALGGFEVKVLDDGWTVVTHDRSLSAHYENTILITAGEPEILTAANHDE